MTARWRPPRGARAVADLGERSACAATGAHAPVAARGNARYESVRWNIARDHRSGGDERVLTDGDAADDRCIGTDRRAATDARRFEGVAPIDLCAWPSYVGEDRGWADEYVGFQRDAGVDRDIVLNAAAVTNDGGRGDENVLAKHATRADACARHHVREMPDFRPRSDARPAVDDRGRVGPRSDHAASNDARSRTSGPNRTSVPTGCAPP